jgi:hypothetical protein
MDWGGNNGSGELISRQSIKETGYPIDLVGDQLANVTACKKTNKKFL